MKIVSQNPILLELGIQEIENETTLHPYYYHPDHYSLLTTLARNYESKDIETAIRGVEAGNCSKPKKQGDYCFFEINSVQNSLLDVAALSSCPRDHGKHAKEGQVLLSKDAEGSIGKSLYADKIIDGMIPSSAFFLFDINTNLFSPEFLTLFFRSKYGFNQVDRRITGTTGKKHLVRKKLQGIKFPLVEKESQELFQKSLLKSCFLNYLAEALVQWIPEFTMDYLGIEMPEVDITKLDSQSPMTNLYFMTEISKINATNKYRMDVHYYKRIFTHLLNQLKKSGYELKKFGDILSYDIKKSENVLPHKEIIGIVRDSINKKTNEIEEPLFCKADEVKACRLKLQENDIIICYSLTSCGVFALVRKAFEESYASKDVFFQLRIDDEVLRGYILALLETPVIHLQIARMIRGTERSHYRCNAEDFLTIILPIPTKNNQLRLGDIYTKNINMVRNLCSISKQLLKLGTTLLEQLIEAETEEDRNRITTRLENLVSDIHAKFFVDDLAQLPDYYDDYTSPEEHQRLIQHMPEDYQYETFEDYKSAGKYIDSDKLEALRDTVEGYARRVLPRERTEEEQKAETLLDLLTLVLQSGGDNFPGILRTLRKDYPEAIKPYELELEKTVEAALSRHNERFEYKKTFNFWELVDYDHIEELKLKQEGKKQFLAYQKEAEENSEARPPEQRLLVYAFVAFLEEKNEWMARQVAEFIDEQRLDRKEKNLYLHYLRQLK